jgi:hypothetical protein
MSRLLSRSPAADDDLERLGGSKEFVLLCACSAVDPTAGQISALAAWQQAPPDWDQFFRLAEHHCILPLAARNLTTHARGLSLAVAEALRTAYDASVRRNLWYAAELARISQHFETRSIRAVPYKGPALAESTYGDLALRTFGDLDFLISSDDFERGRQALAELGYRLSQDYTPPVDRFWLRTGYERAFDGPAGKYLVELQWRLLPRFYAVDLLAQDLLARSGRITVAGHSVPSLAPEDSLLALCLHAAKHLWMRLIWVSDIAETLRTQPIDYRLAFERARTLGVLRILAVSFWLAQNLVGCQLPVAAEELIAGDRAVPRVGGQFAARLARGASYDFESTEYFRLILELREQRSDRWRYLWRLVWTPGAGDLASVGLPERLFPIYRAVRLVRLARKLV